MSHDIPERDWKKLRTLKDDALNISCERIFQKITKLIESTGVVFRLSRAVFVTSMVSAARVSAAAGGVLRSMTRPTHGAVNSPTTAATFTGTTAPRFVGSLCELSGIDYLIHIKRKFALSKTLLLTILSAFILMLLSCGNPIPTEDTDTVTDIDGNVYHTVQIGNQVWTVENLRTTKYNDGSDIPHVTDNAGWINDTTGAYCYYNNTTDTDSIKKFGALYNWYTVDTKKLAPKGWHVPSDSEWTVLKEYLIANGYNWDGTTTGNKIAKAMAARTDWDSTSDCVAGDIGYDRQANNSSGFSALPSGHRYTNGNFDYIGSWGYWWSTTEDNPTIVYERTLLFEDFALREDYFGLKDCGFSVRLVKD